ncbi:elongation of very long chain fatty acids protein F-like [Drosophila navojoa]|uniref:elongation of very long chain fatty acids protein F-like n=1 Tax=Drosophila navojoa TaxID=7232 RepID=UPI0008469FFF|nr:elongation of very long chain fatty acids protein F-like [Drosophila navojoa]
MHASNSSLFNMFELWRADPWTTEVYLLNSPWPVTCLCTAYLLFIYKIGPEFMKHRKPYNLRNIILIYNICQMIYNGSIFLMAFYYLLIDGTYDITCMHTLSLDHPKKSIERWITYIFFMNKIFDLLDTIFFVLRKSYKQITVLHVYHHAMMVYFMYWVTRLYGAGGQYAVMGLCNTTVHFLMYFYYFNAGLRPKMKMNLWWKKYITIAQIVQFMIYLVQSIVVLVFNPTCQFPLFMQWQQIFQSTLMIFLFGNFYYHAYIKPKQKTE